jgi:hypothetical protein
VPFGTQTGFSANSKDKALYVLPEKAPSMGGEQHPTENGSSQDTASLSAYASGPLAEAAAQDKSTSADQTDDQYAAGQQPPSYLLAGLLDVQKDILSLLARSIEGMKSRNQSNGCRVGQGRLKSMTRESWEHLQYAADELSNPQAGIDEILLGIQCLARSGITYQDQEIPWDEIHARYPVPPRRKIKPMVWPGPVEDDIEALAAEYGYPKIVAEPLSDDPDIDLDELAWELALAEAQDLADDGPYVGCLVIPVSPVVAEPVAAPAEIEVEIPMPVATVEPAASEPVALPFDPFDVVMANNYGCEHYVPPPPPVEPLPALAWLNEPSTEPDEPIVDVDENDLFNTKGPGRPYVPAIPAQHAVDLQTARDAKHAARMDELNQEMAEDKAAKAAQAAETMAPAVEDLVEAVLSSGSMPEPTVEEPAAPAPSPKPATEPVATMDELAPAEYAAVQKILGALSHGEWVRRPELFTVALVDGYTPARQAATVFAIKYLVSTNRMIEDDSRTPNYRLAAAGQLFKQQERALLCTVSQEIIQ